MNRSQVRARRISGGVSLLGAFVVLPALLVGAALASGQEGEKYAFLVAVREYDEAELTSLKYTEDDIAALARVLTSTGYRDANVKLLTQTVGATKTRYLPLAKNIRKELDLLLGGLRAQDSIVIALSGHGVQFKGEEDHFFCPADAVLTDRDSLLSIRAIYDALAKCPARTKLLFVDACRNDPRVAGKKAAQEVELEPAGRPQAIVPPGGVIAFYSCSPGQVSWEDADLKHGVFMHYVAQALSGKADGNGDQQVKLGELQDYVATEVYRHVRETRAADQKPQFVGQADGALTLVKFDLSVGPGLAPYHKSTNTVGMTFIYIPAGRFSMGSPVDQPGHDNDETLHDVRITQPFYLGQYEVTLGDFHRFVQDSGYKTDAERGAGGFGFDAATGKFTQRPEKKYSYEVTGFPQTAKSPVVNVTWNDAVAYCRWISAKERKTYRLPTEAEWEYACRAGSTTRYSAMDDPEEMVSSANFIDAAYNATFRANPSRNALKGNDGATFTATVGRYRANAWGLYDMHGNVFEWCQDWHGSYPPGSAIDPTGPTAGKERVARGGSWAHQASWGSAAKRFNLAPDFLRTWLGFRVVREGR